MKNTVETLFEMKRRGEKITQLTCYDYTTACILDAAGIDTLLVGDSLGMTMQGYDTTLPVTLDEMIIYGRSVVRGAKQAFVIIDMPFMSYQVSVSQAVENAGRIIKETGANAVKLEGGVRTAEQIRAITDSGIPVCAHIGMTPQSVNAMGGFRVQGKNEKEAERILKDALAVQDAGAFMCVLECVPPKLSALIAKKTDMITIGIGAGPDSDGQVLVWQDMLGMMGDFEPKFVKRYGKFGKLMQEAFSSYKADVKSGAFPEESHTYQKSDCSDEVLKRLESKYYTEG